MLCLIDECKGTTFLSRNQAPSLAFTIGLLPIHKTFTIR